MIIKTADFVKSVDHIKECPDTGWPEYAFIGRSNVGKSSLINMLAGRKALARISSTPGKTQTLNYFRINDRWYMVDLPGYGWARVSKTKKIEWSKMVNEYLSLRENLTCLFILVDLRLEPQAIDIEFINWAGEKGIPVALLFTKADKVNRSQATNHQRMLFRVLSGSWEKIPDFFITSARDGRGREEILEYIESINQNIL